MALLTLSDPGFPPLLRGPVLVDDRLRPRFWSTVDSFLLHGSLKPSTATIRLRAIERLYRFAEELWPRDTLDGVIGRQDLARLDDLLHAYFSRLRREAQRTGHPADEAWRLACQFATGSCERLLVAGPPKRLAAASALLARLRRLDHHLAVRGRRRRGQPRGLPAGVLEDLYELVSPDSSRNPFRSVRLRWRNFVLFVLLLHQGLRRSEALALAVDAVKSEVDPRHGKERFWLDVCENPHERADPRPDIPSLKNASASRQIPISSALAGLVDTFVVNHRGRRDASFLFYSQKRKPLSKREVNDLFRVLSRHLSKAAQRELWNRHRAVRVTPHDLRHTAAAVRLGQLVGDDHARLPMAIEQVRPFFGWSRDSEMPKLYARTYFEAQIAKVWRDDFDARVEFLRSVP
jgi:integrase